MILFITIKDESDENNCKIESINPSSFTMQLLSHCYNTQAEIWKDDYQLGYTFHPIRGGLHYGP